MNKPLATFVIASPHSTNFVVTLIANVICIITNTLFSFAIIRFAQEWIANHDNITIFDVSVISGFRHQTLPWNIKDIKQLLVANRVVPASLVGICIGAFAFAPSGFTSLINPVLFEKNASFKEAELNLSTTAPNCQDWLEKSYASKPQCNSVSYTHYYDEWFTNYCSTSRQMTLRVSQIKWSMLWMPGVVMLVKNFVIYVSAHILLFIGTDSLRDFK